ncbi:MAG: methyltransferase domain-containing protein [Candidatus Moduliflexus flocculans]|nr:methyltransferase domain-containing protein [Candidatus Moduliflexus flocculans]
MRRAVQVLLGRRRRRPGRPGVSSSAGPAAKRRTGSTWATFRPPPLRSGRMPPCATSPRSPSSTPSCPGPAGAGRGPGRSGSTPLDRLAADMPVEISFDNGRRTTTYLVHPGKPYSFRYDEKGVVKVYPGSHGREDAADLAPFVPTPPEVVARMLELAAVGPRDVVYDVGCGDGRMVIAAAKTYGARGVGIEIDPALLEECRAGARREGVESLVRFVENGRRSRPA